jgi:CheY-like chemotaxis protein
MRKKQILLIDDEPAWLTSVLQLLRDEGFEVRGAQSGAEALKVLAKYHPDLILSDLRMPDMNGFDLLEKIKTLPKMKSTPVVFLSAIDDFHARKVAKDLGAVDCIAKPFYKGDIIPSLQKYLPR